jgi:hypothetical protein
MSEFKTRILKQTLDANEGVFSCRQFAESTDGVRYFPDDEDVPDDVKTWGVQFTSVEDDVLLPQTAVAVGMVGARIESSDWAEFEAMFDGGDTDAPDGF